MIGWLIVLARMRPRRIERRIAFAEAVVAHGVHLAHIADQAVGEHGFDAASLGSRGEQLAPKAGALFAISLAMTKTSPGLAWS